MVHQTRFAVLRSAGWRLPLLRSTGRPACSGRGAPGGGAPPSCAGSGAGSGEGVGSGVTASGAGSLVSAAGSSSRTWAGGRSGRSGGEVLTIPGPTAPVSRQVAVVAAPAVQTAAIFWPVVSRALAGAPSEVLNAPVAL